VEVPIYALALRGRRLLARLALAFVPSTVTHPLVWVSVSFADRHGAYTTALVVAEVGAVLVEAWLIGRFGVQRAMLWSVLANGASHGLGALSRALFDWP
jgi:hypothetical protein